MADEGDMAADYQARHNAEALARRAPAAPRASATHCADCSDNIPRARRTALPGVQRCVECQKDFERKQRGH